MTPFEIYDKEEEEWIGVSFCSEEGAEDYILHELGGNFERYIIYFRLT